MEFKYRVDEACSNTKKMGMNNGKHVHALLEVIKIDFLPIPNKLIGEHATTTLANAEGTNRSYKPVLGSRRLLADANAVTRELIQADARKRKALYRCQCCNQGDHTS